MTTAPFHDFFIKNNLKTKNTQTLNTKQKERQDYTIKDINPTNRNFNVTYQLFSSLEKEDLPNFHSRYLQKNSIQNIGNAVLKMFWHSFQCAYLSRYYADTSIDILNEMFIQDHDEVFAFTLYFLTSNFCSDTIH